MAFGQQSRTQRNIFTTKGAIRLPSALRLDSTELIEVRLEESSPQAVFSIQTMMMPAHIMSWN
jgi:hypothetical protein